MKSFVFTLVVAIVANFSLQAGEKKAEAKCAVCEATKTVTVAVPLTRREKLALPLVKQLQVKNAEVCDCVGTVRTGVGSRVRSRSRVVVASTTSCANCK